MNSNRTLPAIMRTTRLLRSTLPPAYTFRLRYLRSWTLRASCGLRCHPRILFACVTCDHGLYVPPTVYVATCVQLSPALPAIMDTTRLLRSTLPPAYTFRLRYDQTTLTKRVQDCPLQPAARKARLLNSSASFNCKMNNKRTLGKSTTKRSWTRPFKN